MDNKNLPDIRKASDLTIVFPTNNCLEKKEQTRITDAINEGGIVSPSGRCYINNNQIYKILATDKKGAAKVINNAQENDKYEDGNQKYLSTSAVKKNIDERIQEPRSTLKHEQLKYSEECINAFRDSKELEKERHIESDRIAKERPLLTKRKMKEENITECELSGKPFDNDAQGHHMKRASDDPRSARNKDCISKR
ncbi:MAG: hypothetical protein RSC24_16790 [Clostridium sp.]